MMDPKQPDTFDRSISPDRLQLVLRQLAVLVLAMVAMFLFMQLGIFFSDILRILVFSILFSYLFINLVDWLDQLIHKRAMAILIVYLLLGVALILGLVLLVPAVLYQLGNLVTTIFNQFPNLINSIVNALQPLEDRLHAAQIKVRAIDILQSIAQNVPKPDPSLLLGNIAISTMGGLFYGLSILVLSFYFLLDGHNIKESIIRMFPQRHYVSLTLLAADLDLTVQAFFRGQVVLAVVFSTLMFALYTALGIHYALFLCVALAAWEIIPVIGPTIGFVPTLVSVCLDGMDNVHLGHVWDVVLIIIIFNLCQWLKDNVVAPKYIGNVIGLHPVMVFIAIMVGARLDGMAGVICALPAACVINVLITHQISRAQASKRSALHNYTGGVEANHHAAALMKEIEAKQAAANSP